MSMPKKGMSGKPPPLKPVPRAEDSMEQMEMAISETGTLHIDVHGQPVAVRSWGSVTGGPDAAGGHGKDGSREGNGFSGKFKYDDLKMGHVIGEGSQAKVRRVRHKPTGETYALKVITLGKAITKKALQQELSRVLGNTNHRNVVRSAEAFYIDGALKILMEFMDCGTLSGISKQVGPIREDMLSCITRQILLGLDSLHAAGVVHRDIKPSNLLANSQGIVKISDFGVSTLVDSVNPFAITLIGSTAYMSPERVRAEKYDTLSDIWSVGLTVAQLALGFFPFYTDDAQAGKAIDENPFERKPNMFDLAAMIGERRARIDFDVLLDKIRRFYPECVHLQISRNLKDFVDACMKQESSERLDCRALLNTPFITKYQQISEGNLESWLKTKGIGIRKTRSSATATPLSTSSSSSLAEPVTGGSSATATPHSSSCKE